MMHVSTSSALHDVTTASLNLTSTMNISEKERDRYLSYLDDIVFPKMLPAVIYLFILMVIGIFGNILVLIVYIKKFKPCPIRVFVVSLAVFDLITCVVSMPGEMLDMRYTYTFNYPSICRLLRFCTAFTVLSSGFTLVAVAIDRYRKICRPLQEQITIRGARIMVGVAVSGTLILAIPTVIVNGRTTVITDQEGITGFHCSFDDRWHGTLFPLVYTGVLFLVFFGSLTVLIVMYILIGKTVFSHRRFKFNRSSDPKVRFPENSTSESKRFSVNGKENSGKRWLISIRRPQNVKTKLACISPRKTIPTSELTNTFKEEESSQSKKVEVDNSPKSETVTNTLESEPSSNGTTLAKFKSNRSNSAVKAYRKTSPRRTRTTLILFIITALLIITFLPYLSLLITREFKSGFVENLQGGEIIMYNIFLRSYFISSAANCLVYSFYNFRFRNECKNLLAPCLNLKK